MNYESHSPSRDLKERTFTYARRIIHLYAKLPKSTVPQTLGRQLLRSGTSVGANYREAFRARSRAEFLAKMGDCLKELDESEFWLQLIASEKIFPPQRLTSLLQETDELLRIFTTISKRTKTSSATLPAPSRASS